MFFDPSKGVEELHILVKKIIEYENKTPNFIENGKIVFTKYFIFILEINVAGFQTSTQPQISYLDTWKFNHI